MRHLGVQANLPARVRNAILYRSQVLDIDEYTVSTFVDIYACPCISLDLRGRPSVSLDIYRFPGVFPDIHVYLQGYPWTYMVIAHRHRHRTLTLDDHHERSNPKAALAKGQG